MNSVYFRCETCKRYVDAGYRWAYSTLVEPGIVREDDFASGGTTLPVVHAHAVLSAEPYWRGEAEGGWLAEQLGRVREFLAVHQSHQLSFGDAHRLLEPPEEWLRWLCDDPAGEPSPRYFAEILQLRSWGEVQKHVSAQGKPWWWLHHELRLAARREFERLSQSLTAAGGGSA